MLGLFAVLGILHVVCNGICTLQLRLAGEEPPPQPSSPASSSSTASARVAFWRRMFLPPGYPRTTVDSYARYQMWARLETAVSWPRAVATQMVTWQHLYGVGNAGSTPVAAVRIDLRAWPMPAGATCHASCSWCEPSLMARRMDRDRLLGKLLSPSRRFVNN